jgi:molybdopterin molybdotransferase
LAVKHIKEKITTQTGTANMISPAEAKELIVQNSNPLNTCIVPLQQAAGLVMAKDIYAPVDIPAFPQSGMDGYAIDFSSLGKPISMAGEQAAGSDEHTTVKPGTAVRIFTGAVVPDGADTVVVQEKSKVIDGLLYIEDDHLKQGDNVRLPGSEIAKDALALPAGTMLSPPAIGFLAGMGIAAVEVIPIPRVSIIVTGNELQQPGTIPQFGKVYESNSFALQAVLKQLHITDIAIHQSADDIETLTRVLNEALATSDIILMTGGVSVGDYDFTVTVSEKCGIGKVFHKIKQKPGKPLFFGKKENLLFFGLPGNPASVLTCFYEYVIPALEKLTTKKLNLEVKQVPLSTSYKKTAGITHFLKGLFDGQQVHLPPGQESYKLNSFARANCLVVIPETITEVQAGEKIEIHLLL